MSRWNELGVSGWLKFRWFLFNLGKNVKQIFRRDYFFRMFSFHDDCFCARHFESFQAFSTFNNLLEFL